MNIPPDIIATLKKAVAHPQAGRDLRLALKETCLAECDYNEGRALMRIERIVKCPELQAIRGKTIGEVVRELGFSERAPSDLSQASESR